MKTQLGPASFVCPTKLKFLINVKQFNDSYGQNAVTYLKDRAIIYNLQVCEEWYKNKVGDGIVSA